jgi:hypothetical protein
MEPRRNTSLKERPEFRAANVNTEDICSLDVSLNNRYQEGAYLAGTVQWINRRFKYCIVNLGDTLHRHNLAIGSTDMEQAHIKSREMGNRWLENNGNVLDGFEIPNVVIRNDDWIFDEDFPGIHEELWGFYYTNRDYRLLVNNDVESYLFRKPERQKVALKKSGLAYLLEETAADILMARDHPAVHLYPGSWHKSYFHLINIPEKLPVQIRGLEKCSFKRISPSKVVSSRQRKLKIS